MESEFELVQMEEGPTHSISEPGQHFSGQGALAGSADPTSTTVPATEGQSTFAQIDYPHATVEEVAPHLRDLDLATWDFVSDQPIPKPEPQTTSETVDAVIQELGEATKALRGALNIKEAEGKTPYKPSTPLYLQPTIHSVQQAVLNGQGIGQALERLDKLYTHMRATEANVQFLKEKYYEGARTTYDEIHKVERMILDNANQLSSTIHKVASNDDKQLADFRTQAAETAKTLTDMIRQTKVDVLANVATVRLSGLVQAEDTRTEVKALQPHLDQLTHLVKEFSAKPLTSEEFEKKMEDTMRGVLESSATESILANAVARGLGAAAATTILNLIISSITEPFHLANESTEAISNVANTVKSVVDTVQTAVDLLHSAKEAIHSTKDDVVAIRDAIVGGVQNIKDTQAADASLITAQAEGIKAHTKSQLAKVATKDQVGKGINMLGKATASNTEGLAKLAKKHADQAGVERQQLGRLAHDNIQLATQIKEEGITRGVATKRKIDEASDKILGHINRSQPSVSDGISPAHKKVWSDNLKRRKTKFGDHSVYMVGVAEHPMYQDASMLDQLTTTPNWWGKAWGLMRLWQERINQTPHHSFKVSSDVYTKDADLYDRLDVNQSGEVLFTATDAVAADALSMIKVRAGVAVQTGTIDPESMSEFMIGGMANDRTLTGLLQGKLHVGNINALKESVSVILHNLATYDNTLMYAKGMHYYFIKSHCEMAGFAPRPHDWDNDIRAFNMADANMTAFSFQREVMAGRIAFVIDVDGQFNAATDLVKLQCLSILSSGGMRFQAIAANNERMLEARYVDWPKIPITIFKRDDAAIAPAAALVESDVFINFLQSVAIRRGEMDQLVRGLYVAMDLLGCYFVPKGAGAATHHLDNLFGHTTYELPAPRDSNMLLKLLDINNATSAEVYSQEWYDFTKFEKEAQFKALALYIKVENVAATTLMAGLHVSKQACMDWMSNAVRMSIHSLRSLILAYNSPPTNVGPSDLYTDAIFRINAKAAAGKLLGFNNIRKLYQNTLWLGQLSSLPPLDVTALYATAGLARHAPRKASAFCVFNYIKEIPYEWGISAYGASYDVSKEIVARGPDDRRGWYAIRGSKKYSENTASQEPYCLEMYGWQVINLMCNARYAAGAPPDPKFSKAVTGFEVIDQPFDPPAADDTYLAAWNDTIRCYEPNTFISYTWGNSMVAAPALLEAGAAGANWWKNYKGKDSTNKSYGWQNWFEEGPVESVAPVKAINLTPGFIGALRGLGMPSGSSKGQAMPEVDQEVGSQGNE